MAWDCGNWCSEDLISPNLNYYKTTLSLGFLLTMFSEGGVSTVDTIWFADVEGCKL